MKAPPEKPKGQPSIQNFLLDLSKGSPVKPAARNLQRSGSQLSGMTSQESPIEALSSSDDTSDLLDGPNTGHRTSKPAKSKAKAILGKRLAKDSKPPAAAAKAKGQSSGLRKAKATAGKPRATAARKSVKEEELEDHDEVFSIGNSSTPDNSPMSDSDYSYKGESLGHKAKKPKKDSASGIAASKGRKPLAAKHKPAARPRKTKAPPAPPSTSSFSSEEEETDENKAPAPKKRRVTQSPTKPLTVEQIYQKKTQLEHILLRPDTYVGSITELTQQMWIYDDELGNFAFREITFVPGLYKIFDEILVNAADNKQRDPEGMTVLKVELDQEKGSIKVWNNGKGIPVVVHKEHNVYIPELIFGHLLTGSNFNDHMKKTTGGRNGYGAKLANIFSTEFTVETYDSKEGLKYKQTFTNNMSKRKDPKISSPKSKSSDYTCIIFKPDFKRFGMSGFDKDTLSLMKKRVYDMAGVTDKSLRVYLNGEKIKVQSFPQYVEMYKAAAGQSDAPKIFEKVNDRWEVAVTVSDGSFQQISFVNAIATTKGGQHVNYVTEQMVSRILASVNKKNKDIALKPAQVRNQLFVFVNCLIENPAFDSQTKETLTTTMSSFGSKCVLSEKFLKKLEKSPIVDQVQSWVKYKQNQQLQRKSGSKCSRLTGIAKLDDANFAGTAKGQDCTLILTEGDSAKALALSGLGVIGRDYYGIYPLKGKLLNVREASHAQIMKNEEIQQVVRILGLKFGKEYPDTKSLRYGHLMIMADQDHDGSHIKGLVINFIHFFWPSLIKIPGFLREFITPIVKVSKGNQHIAFYTTPEYDKWKSDPEKSKGWSIKYYKGLGTSTAKEAKEYFSDLKRHRITFKYRGEEDTNAIDMAFSKKRVAERKEWLNHHEVGTHVDYTIDSMHYGEFINKELILFSVADNIRSISLLMDGLKPSQRKVLFCCFKRNLVNEVKVAQLAGYVSEHSAYHHGEASLMSTIIGMAQGFVGSNNLHLLVPSGQFGTRIMGGKDAASARYIFTRLDPVTRLIFRQEDDAILHYLDEDGQSIEPSFYVPILPMVLVNGSEGIGTGWSSQIPNYNPRDIIQNLRLLLKDERPVPMDPWYRGFDGVIQPKDGGMAFTANGLYSEVDDCTIKIRELPLKTWTSNYKLFLEGVLTSSEKTSKLQITNFDENHTDTTVSFTVKMTPDGFRAAQTAPGGFLSVFKLEGSISTSNMNLFNADGHIQKYQSPIEILEAFFPVRLQFYQKRKDHMVRKLEQELVIIKNKVRFIEAVVGGVLQVNNRKKQDIVNDLSTMRFHRVDKNGASVTEDEEEVELGVATESVRGYDYLLSMQIWSLTTEKIQKLRGDLVAKEQELNILQSKTTRDLWLEDLDALEAGLDAYDERVKAEQGDFSSQSTNKASRKRKAPSAALKRK